MLHLQPHESTCLCFVSVVCPRLRPSLLLTVQMWQPTSHSYRQRQEHRSLTHQPHRQVRAYSSTRCSSDQCTHNCADRTLYMYSSNDTVQRPSRCGFHGGWYACACWCRFKRRYARCRCAGQVADPVYWQDTQLISEGAGGEVNMVCSAVCVLLLGRVLSQIWTAAMAPLMLPPPQAPAPTHSPHSPHSQPHPTPPSPSYKAASHGYKRYSVAVALETVMWVPVPMGCR